MEKRKKNPQKICVKICEIQFLYCQYVIMNKNFNRSTCAVCFEVKGEHSKTLNKITKGIEEKIVTYIWPAYNLGISVCPSVICSNCRRNLFCLDQPNIYQNGWKKYQRYLLS